MGRCADTCTSGEIRCCGLCEIALAPCGSDYFNEGDYRLISQFVKFTPTGFLLYCSTKLGVLLAKFLRQGQLREVPLAYVYAVARYQICKRKRCWLFWKKRVFQPRNHVIRVRPSSGWALQVGDECWRLDLLKRPGKSEELKAAAVRAVRAWCSNQPGLHAGFNDCEE